MAVLMPEGKQSFTNDAGVPLSGGKLYTYAAGTTTPKTTWSDNLETAPNTNPIILNARGEATIFWNGVYKVELRTAADAVIWTVDNVSAPNDAALISFIQDGAGAVTRTAQAKMRDLFAVTDFGGPTINNGVTDATSAVTAADAISGKNYSPRGIYDTTLADGVVEGPFWGEGQIRISTNDKLAPWYSHIKTPPSSFGAYTSIITAFNGDLSRNQLAMGHRITGSTTAGTPATGYLYRPEISPVFGYIYNESGHNESLSGNDGRTGICFNRLYGFHAGQGDLALYNGTMFVTGAKAGATNFLANPAGVLFNGDMQAGANGVYLNPYETICQDGGFDVACVGLVTNFERTNGTGALGVFWSGLRVQNTGAVGINQIVGAIGKANAGIDFAVTDLDFGANQAAVSLRAGQRIYFNNQSSNNIFTTAFNGDYINYTTGTASINVVVGGTAALQVTVGQVTGTVPFVATNIRATAATAASAAGQLGFGTTTAATATAGASGAVPAQVVGYLVASLGGVNIKIPYYAN
jgi:hypothetical protein